MDTGQNIASLVEQLREKNHLLQRRLGYELAQKTWKEYAALASAVDTAFLLAHTTAYAYSPRENVGSKGTYHIILKEDCTRGRFTRKSGDALCKPRQKFWGLDEREEKTPLCLGCLERAIKLSKES